MPGRVLLSQLIPRAVNNLVAFLIRYSTWILFIFYVILSSLMLFRNNPYQHYLFLSSANGVSSTVYKGVNGVTSYFHLRDINEDLQHRNSDLEMEILHLKKVISSYQDMEYAESLSSDSIMNDYKFVIAHVINNSIYKPKNYITLDKGSLDGITKDMGVVDQNGVVGAVDLVAPHSSRVISLLNPDFNVSVKVKGSDHVGTLRWDGKDYREAVIHDLPKHAVFHKGDTIVTSGFSGFFPKDVPVGIIDTEETEGDFLLRVRIFTDFSTLSTVRVIGDRLKEEIRQVEEVNDSENKQ